MIDQTPAEPDSNAPARSSSPVWLVAMGLMALSLFLLGSWTTEAPSRSPVILEESAALADRLIDGGLPGVRGLSVAQSPVGFLTRWSTATVLLLNPTDDDGPWARALACVLWALSWWGLVRFTLGRGARLGSPEPWILLGLLLVSPPARDAAQGELSGAIMLAAGVAFALGCQRLARGPETTWFIGALWGFMALLHPALMALGIPIFVFGARAYRRGDDVLQAAPGHASLPHVPLSLMASPVVAAFVYLGLWTLVGGGVGDLGVMLDGLWRQEVAGGDLLAIGPSPGAALGSGLAILGWPLTLLAVFGSLTPPGRRDRRIPWFVLATVLLAGGLNGNLHEPSASLMLFSLPFVAALALEGPIRLRTGSPT